MRMDLDQIHPPGNKQMPIQKIKSGRPVVLKTHGLTKSYGAVTAVKDIDLSVQVGERLVILGPNGAGKSSLLNILAGEISPSSGSVEIFGKEAANISISSRVKMGVRRTFQHSQLLALMTVEQHLALAIQAYAQQHWSLRAALSSERREAAHQLAHRCRIEGLLHKQANELSHGERRQLELAMGMGGAARMLLLDEPAAGLSPSERVWLKEWIVALDREVTVLLIEHDMDVALTVADRVVVMQNGVVAFRGDVNEVTGNAYVQEIYLGSHVQNSQEVIA